MMLAAMLGNGGRFSKSYFMFLTFGKIKVSFLYNLCCKLIVYKILCIFNGNVGVI